MCSALFSTLLLQVISAGADRLHVHRPNADFIMTERSRVLEESEVPRRYTDETDDSVLNGSKRRPSQTSLDVLFHDRIT